MATGDRFVVDDDLSSDAKTMSNPILKNLCQNGRHYFITLHWPSSQEFELDRFEQFGVLLDQPIESIDESAKEFKQNLNKDLPNGSTSFVRPFIASLD